MSVDLALDPVTHKLIFPLRVIRGPEKVAQSLRIHLRTWLSEWFLDLDHGVPYLGGVLGKQDPVIVEQILRQQALSVEGVRRMETFRLMVDEETRRARVMFVGHTDEGQVEGIVQISLKAFGNV